MKLCNAVCNSEYLFNSSSNSGEIILLSPAKSVSVSLLSGTNLTKMFEAVRLFWPKVSCSSCSKGKPSIKEIISLEPSKLSKEIRFIFSLTKAFEP